MERNRKRTTQATAIAARLLFILVAWLGLAAAAQAQTSITLSPCCLSDGYLGEPYNETLSASGGSAPYVFGVASGSLPPGLTLDSAGAITGTPTSTGSFGFLATATDTFGSVGSMNYTIDVYVPPSITPSSLSDAVVGEAYSEQLQVINGFGSYFFGLSSGELPPGLTLSPGGLLEGVPETHGEFGFTVIATPLLLVDGGSSGPAQNAAVAPSGTVTASYSMTVAAVVTLAPATLPDGAVGTAYAQDLAAAGGTPPYNIHLVSGTLPYGLDIVSTGADSARLEGTPTTDGDYSFVLGAMDANGFFATNAYDVAIAAPVITLAPGTLPDATLGSAYSQAISASGGTAPYSFFIGGGSLPPGLDLAADGTLSGTPTALGDFAFTVYATGSFGYQGSIDYVLGVLSDPPVAVDDVASTASQQPVSIDVVANDSGSISAIALASPPAHGSASIDGLSVTYTPTGTYFGDDSFSYLASGPGGTSSPATVTVHVLPLPVPVGVPQSLSVLAGESVAFDAAAGASGGPITAVTIVQPPTVGTVGISGTQISYSTPADASGVQQVGYVLSNAYGDSAPVVSTIAIDARPVAPELHATTPMGIAVELDLTAGASGGPFVDAAVQGVTPAGAGTAMLLDDGDGTFRLRFTPDASFSGEATVGFTLSNAQATSAPGTATIDVTERDDPTLDPEVGGILRAQVFTVREFVQAQINNVQQRLEELHEPGSRPWGFWIGGTVRHGDRNGSGAVAPASFETSGLTSGADYRFSDRFAFGGALGHGRDRTEVGHEGGRSDARAESAMGYGSFKPSLPFYLDGLAGHQRITFQLQRVDPASGEVITMPRDGVQSYSSWSSGYEHKNDRWMIASYGRMDVSQARLDAYEEAGDPLQALAFDEMAIQTRTSTLGVRGRFKREIRWGTLEPKFRIEFQRDFHDASGAVIRYADQDEGGAAYVLPADGIDRGRAIIEVGGVLRTIGGMVLRLELRSIRGGANDSDNAISFSLQDDH